jgi:hypothetical protein
MPLAFEDLGVNYSLMDVPRQAAAAAAAALLVLAAH